MHITTSNQSVLDLGFRDYTCNWGVHIAGLYETPEERDELVYGFLGVGDQAGDLQLYCQGEKSKEHIHAALSAAWPSSQKHLDDPKHFQMFGYDEIYYPNGSFSARDMEQALENLYAQSQVDGPRNVRAAAEMNWALDSVPGGEEIMVYESRTNTFVRDKRWVSLCLYDVARFNGAQIMDVLRTHPYTINGGVVTENPFYQDPDIWLAANAPQYLSTDRD